MASARASARAAGSNPATVIFSALERTVLAMAMRRALGPAAQAAGRWRAKKSRASEFGQRSNEPIMQCDIVTISIVTVTFDHVDLGEYARIAWWMT